MFLRVELPMMILMYDYVRWLVYIIDNDLGTNVLASCGLVFTFIGFGNMSNVILFHAFVITIYSNIYFHV